MTAEARRRRRRRKEWPHSVTAVVLAAGGGSRLSPLTEHLPKEMIRFWGKPVLHYILDNIRMARIPDAVLVVSAEKEEAIRGYFRRGRRVGVRLSYALQKERRGPADAIVAACSTLESEYILVQYGDSLADENIPLRLMEKLERTGWKADGVLALRNVDEPRRYGVARLDHGKVVEVVEKPETPPSDLAVMGTFVMKTEAFLESVGGARFEGGRGELFPAQYMLRMGASFEGWVFRGERVDVGTPENLFDGSVLTRRMLRREGESVPKVGVMVFDSDNTLLRTREAARAADMGAMDVLSSKVGRPSVELYEEWTKVVSTVSSSTDPRLRQRRHSYGILAQRYGEGPSADAMDAAFLHGLEKVRPVPGAKKLLQELGSKRLFIATEDGREPAMLKLRKAGLLEFFEGVVTSEEVGTMKPSPRYYEKIMRRTGARPPGVLVAGDSFEKDLVPAILLGTHVLLVKDPRDLRRLRLLE